MPGVLDQAMQVISTDGELPELIMLVVDPSRPFAAPAHLDSRGPPKQSLPEHRRRSGVIELHAQLPCKQHRRIPAFREGPFGPWLAPQAG